MTDKEQLKEDMFELLNGLVISSLDGRPLEYMKALRYEVGHSGVYTVEKLELLEYLNKLIKTRETENNTDELIDAIWSLEDSEIGEIVNKDHNSHEDMNKELVKASKKKAEEDK